MGMGRSRQVSALSTSTSAGALFGIDRFEDLTSEEFNEFMTANGLKTFSDTLDAQGFSGLPTQMTEEELNTYIANGAFELARGISASTEDEYNNYINELLNGNFYIEGGEAYFGQGMYAYGKGSLASAAMYGKVTRMALAPDAKVFTREVESPELSTLFSRDGRLEEYAQMMKGDGLAAHVMRDHGLTPVPMPGTDMLFSDRARYMSEKKAATLANQKISRAYINTNLPKRDADLVFKQTAYQGTEALAAKGYDAIRLTPEYVNNSSNNGYQDIWIVLNRTKVAVQV